MIVTSLKSVTPSFDTYSVDLFPNTLSFRVVTTLDVDSESQIPMRFTGRVRKLNDGVVEWQSCIEEDAALNVEVNCTHIGMAFHPGVYRSLGRLLAAV